MSFTHVLKQEVQTAAGTVSTTFQVSDDAQSSLSLPVPGESTDLEALVNIDVSQVKAFFLLSDQDVTVETNSPSAPDDTIALKANKAYVWYSDDYDAFLLTADVTALYVTNAGATAATVELRVLFDPTP